MIRLTGLPAPAEVLLIARKGRSDTFYRPCPGGILALRNGGVGPKGNLAPVGGNTCTRKCDFFRGKLIEGDKFSVRCSNPRAVEVRRAQHE